MSSLYSKYFTHRFATLRYGVGGVGCLLAIAAHTAVQTTPAIAADIAETILISSRAYNPPAGSQSSGGASTGGGVRGCGEEMIAIAPAFGSPGRTFSERPTLVWYLGDVPSEQLQLTLFHQGPAGETEIFSQELTITTAGYQAFTLPTTAEPLQVGETYRWVTTLYCDPASTEAIRWVEAEIQVVEPPPSLPLLDSIAPTPWQKGIRFARAGYWYDALAQVYADESLDGHALRQAMLFDLADLAASADTSAATRWSDRLRDLADVPYTFD